ncbi:hypothetical protein CHLRE_12g552450v5 [Chlamydomonas reinhardtii]|uniref:Uncharacterized protein n=1 Tax=Chlamydomonas reinhardtii TaxID=3055 RepID=A8IYK7_CHLRE|nr:uncharacterized protein CHLRE_12g552450v5 [Chlamydomonas reinhardtii]PNW75979.1 hypothetical protein CHLRE_12g552450v5 [Chlamydomonas reinhardtii]|eukprot:XP_001694017.1 predicted protein [Chlamydomonas reinhardtii]
MSPKTRSGVADSEVGPGELPDDARKYGSGHPFTQSAQDKQGMVTGCDEVKPGEDPPAAMLRLAHEVAEQGVEPQGQRQQQQQHGGGGVGGARGDNRQMMAQEGSAAATGGYSEGD